MKKDKNQPIREILTSAGYACVDNRTNRWFKTLAELVEAGIEVKVCESKMVWRKDDKKWNIVVRGFGLVMRYYVNETTFVPYTLVKAIAVFLQNEKTKERVRAHVNTDLSCDRCQGQGFIPAFSYYCDGICFECYGTGYSRHKKLQAKIISVPPVADVV